MHPRDLREPSSKHHVSSKTTHFDVATEQSGLAVPTAAFLTFGTRPVSGDWLYRRASLTEFSQGLFQVSFHLPGMSLLLTRKSQRGSTTIHEEEEDPSAHDPHCSATRPTDTEKQSEFSRPRSYFTITSRFARPIWPFWGHKGSPTQTWALESHSDSCTSQAPLRFDPTKVQSPSPTTSVDSCTLHYSIRSNAIGALSLSAIPQSPLDIPPTFTASSIPLRSPSTTGQQAPQSSQLVTHQLSEDQPIRRLPTPPGIGQVPVYIPKEGATHRHSPKHSIPPEESGSKEPDQSAVSIAVIEVHTETSSHDDPPQTNSSSTGHRRNESVVTMNSPGQEEGTCIPQPRRTRSNSG